MKKQNPPPPENKQPAAPTSKDAPKEQSKQAAPKQQETEIPQKEREARNAAQEMEQLNKVKQTMMQYQEKYFETLRSKEDPTSQKISMRNTERVEDKILNAIRKGVLQLENSKYNYVEGHMLDKKVLNVEKEKDELQSKLQNIDSELKTLKGQKINNAYSAYSQPTLKLYQQEENLQKQQEAKSKIDKINLEKKTREEQAKKLQEKRKEKEEQEKELRRKKEEEENLKLKQEMQQKLKDHIQELKQKHENRLKDMDKIEEQYFNDLNQKLKKLAAERQHISNLELPKDSIQPFSLKVKKGQQKRTDQLKMKEQIDKDESTLNPLERRKYDVKKQKEETNKKKEETKKKQKLNRSLTPELAKSRIQDDGKKIEIERPLYERVKDEYDKKIREQDLKILEERKEQQQFYSQYSVDYEQHMMEHRRILKQKQKEYEAKRMRFLQELGLREGKFSQNVNASFDSKLWLLQESRVNKSLDDISLIPKEMAITLAKEKKSKETDYDKKIKQEIKINKNKELEDIILLSKDKTLHPERYIKMVKKNNKQAEKESDYEIFLREEELRKQQEQERKEKEKEEYQSMVDKVKQQIKADPKKLKEIEQQEKEERKKQLEQDLQQAKIKREKHKEEFKQLHQGALEQEKQEKKEKEEKEKEREKKKKLDLPIIETPSKIVKNQSLGTLERHDYLKEVKKKYHLEDRAVKRSNIDKLFEEMKEVEKKEQEKPEELKLPALSEWTEDEKKKRQQDKIRKLHNKRVDEIKKRYQDEKVDNSIPEESRIEKIYHLTNQIDLKTKSMEQVNQAQWSTKPLRSVDKAIEIDNLYIKSIETKLKALDIQSQKSSAKQ